VATVASRQTRPARADRADRADRAEIDLRRLVAGFLRMAPDVAIVGEVRDREALPCQLRIRSQRRDLRRLKVSVERPWQRRLAARSC
jgi:pilus assembly protein CpaF